MIARVLIDGVVLSRYVDGSDFTDKDNFVNEIIKRGGIWDDGTIYFYPYHMIERIEFRRG